jgi:hypothetical protein
MGHIRLGRLPKTRSWQKVVSLLGSGEAPPAAVADATLRAAIRLRPILEREIGLIEAFHFLGQICYAARSEEFFDRCSGLGIDLGEETNRAVPLAFLAAAGNALESKVRGSQGRTLFSDIALQAFREALTRAVNTRPDSLFGHSEEELRRTFKELSRTQNFNTVSRDFFSSFLRRTLGYFLGKEIHNHIGKGRALSEYQKTEEFESALKHYCDERAVIVERFAGEYTSKQNWHGDLNEETARRFIFVAVKKLTEELSIAEAAPEDRPEAGSP